VDLSQDRCRGGGEATAETGGEETGTRCCFTIVRLYFIVGQGLKRRTKGREGAHAGGFSFPGGERRGKSF